MSEKPHVRGNPYLPFIFGLIVLLGASGTYYLFAQERGLPIKQPVSLELDRSGSAIVAPVREQLQYLKIQDSKKAYRLVAEQFKEVMPLDNFEDFVKQYSILASYQQLSFSQPETKDETAIVTAYLHGDGGTIPIEYALISEGNRWKILGFIINQGAVEEEELESLSELFPVVNQQLLAFRKNQIAEAYSVVSQQFKEQTDQGEFGRFAQRYPILSTHAAAQVMGGEINENRAVLKVIITKGEESVPLEYHLVKEGDDWKIVGLRVLYPQASLEPLEEVQQSELLSAIEGQLEAIQMGDARQAYEEFSSDEFKKMTSFNVFQAFLEDHPGLTRGGSVKYLDGGVEGEIAIVHVTFGERPNLFHLTYRLIEDDEGWKVLGMTLEAKSSEDMQEKLSTTNPAELVDQIESSLHLIAEARDQDFYDRELSAAFRDGTSFQQFLMFLEDHPDLRNHPKVELVDVGMERDQYHVTVNLISEMGENEALFILSEGEKRWLIDRIEIQRAEASTVETQGDEITVVVGTELGPMGYIKNPSDQIKGLSLPLFLNLYIPNSRDEEQLKVILVHQTTRSKTFPVFADLEGGGNKIVSFSFAPPPGGWPAGDYEFLVTTPYREVRHKIQISE